jgi:hypothetical protein
MKKLILIALLFIGFNSYAQFDKGGVIALSNKAVFALDTSARNIIHIIEDERIAGGGVKFSEGEKQYVNYIVTNLKSIGVWYKCKAIYGFVGGTAASDKWNWKDMRDLDAAFRLSYSGTLIHSNNGMQGDGTTGFANTFLNPSISLTINSQHLSVFVNLDPTGVGNRCEIGAATQSPYVEISLLTNYLGGIFYPLITNVSVYPNIAVLNGLGYSIANRIDGNFIKGFRNGVLLVNGSQPAGLVNLPISILSTKTSSGNSRFSDKRIGVATIGSGLTDSEALSTSQIINFAQAMRANF